MTLYFMDINPIKQSLISLSTEFSLRISPRRIFQYPPDRSVRAPGMRESYWIYQSCRIRSTGPDTWGTILIALPSPIISYLAVHSMRVQRSNLTFAFLVVKQRQHVRFRFYSNNLLLFRAIFMNWHAWAGVNIGLCCSVYLALNTEV